MSKNIIQTYKGDDKEVDCIGCARERGELGKADTVYKTKYFDAHQDFEVPIPGFIIVSTRRHIQSIDEFSLEEADEFLKVMMTLRAAQRKVLGIDTIYLHQEEDTSHHFHFWMLPRYDWMAEKFGVKVESVRPIMEYARQKMKTKDNLKEVQEGLGKLMIYCSS